MPRVHLHDLARIGEIHDVGGHELPPDALWVTYNMRGENKYLTNLGSSVDLGGTIPITGRQIFFVEYPTKQYWAICNDDEVVIYDTALETFHNISPYPTLGTSFTGDADDQWNACWFNGVWVVNNGVDIPQYWPTGITTDRLQPLVGWTGGWRAKVIRPYRNFLVALNITKAGSPNSSLVWWSHPADPGAPPASWNIADPTKLAGELQLAMTDGEIVDGLALRDAFVIYKKDAIVLMQYAGGNDVFSFRDVSTRTGLMGQNCVVEFKPGYHFLLTSDADAMVFNGQTLESVASGRVLNTLRASGFNSRSFVCLRKEKNEVWIALVGAADAGGVDFDYWHIWNWETGAWTTSGQSVYRDIATGSMNLVYGASVGTQGINEVAVALDSAGTQLVLVDQQAGQTGAVGTYSYFYQEFISFDGGQAQDGSPRVDFNRHKVLTELWPNVTGTNVLIDITISSSDKKEDVWANYQTFTFDPATDVKVDCLLDGKYFQMDWVLYPAPGYDECSFRVYGYSLEYQESGVYR